ncbi:hypothetical protein [Lutispora saccharofermentans]|uniref:Uncharacterized protein n=1 Tax=Lutispora saccharofermentans TaxID=3024236 RepID=A0ABT1NGY6_9FIRM|nr:hypothetical protein [Lutispora saccharofermentans]MCQ1530522.1 hypothetical protein [Lutispora saccharofermentans]
MRKRCFKAIAIMLAIALFLPRKKKVYGNGHFGIPEELARINYSPFTSMWKRFIC